MRHHVAAGPAAPAWLPSDDGRAAFDAVWERLALPEGAWRMHRVGDEVFVKGLVVPLVCHTQAWRRRWDIRREAANLTSLQGSDAPTPELLAWGEQLRAGLPVRGWLSTRTLPDAESIAPVIVRHVAQGTPAELEPRLLAVGRGLRRFHQSGWVHLDLSVRNAMVQRTPDGWRGWIIDLARAQQPSSPARFAAGHRIDLYRLAKTALRRKLAPEHIAPMIEAAAPGEGERVTEVTQAIRAISNRYLRMARYHTWVRRGR